MNIKIYTLPDCADCGFLRRFLQQRCIPFEEMCIETPAERAEFNELFPEIMLVPLVTMDGKPLVKWQNVLELVTPATPA